MKKIYLLIILLYSGITALAQDYFFDPAKRMSDTVETENISVMYMHIIPADSNKIVLKWELISNSMDTNWSISLCDYPNCYPGIPDSGIMDTITAAQIQSGLTPFFQLIALTSDSASEGDVLIYISDANDATKGDTVSFHISNVASSDTGNPTGIVVPKMTLLSVYPNPAADVISITNDAAAHLCIYNAQGEMVICLNVAEGVSTISTAGLPSGSYFIQSHQDRTIEKATFIKR